MLSTLRTPSTFPSKTLLLRFIKCTFEKASISLQIHTRSSDWAMMKWRHHRSNPILNTITGGIYSAAFCSQKTRNGIGDIQQTNKTSMSASERERERSREREKKDGERLISVYLFFSMFLCLYYPCLCVQPTDPQLHHLAYSQDSDIQIIQ